MSAQLDQLDMRAAAIDYVTEHRLAVFPLHPVHAGRCQCPDRRCTNPGKHPISGGWQKTIPSPMAAVSAWPRDTRRGIGLLCGPASGCFAVDIDPRHGGNGSLAELEREHGTLPETWSSQTGGGGRHLLFAWPDVDVRNSTGQVAAGIDVRGAGGFIVLPPSRHASGEPYAWEHAPGSVELADVPDWLLELARRRARRHRPSAPGAPITGGARHDALVSLLGLMRSWGAAAPVLEAAAEAFVEHQCAPDPNRPLDVEHARAQARWIAANYELDPFARRSITTYQDRG